MNVVIVDKTQNVRTHLMIIVNIIPCERSVHIFKSMSVDKEPRSNMQCRWLRQSWINTSLKKLNIKNFMEISLKSNNMSICFMNYLCVICVDRLKFRYKRICLTHRIDCNLRLCREDSFVYPWDSEKVGLKENSKCNCRQDRTCFMLIW